MTLRTVKLNGLILSRYNSGESDRSITVFTLQNGKIKLRASGVRRLNSKRAPHLELFNETELVVYNGRGTPLITEAKSINDFSKLKSDLKLSAYAFYLVEVIDKLLAEAQPNSNVYAYVIRSLKTLNSGLNEDEALQELKRCLLNIVSELGFLPENQAPQTSLNEFIESVAEKRIRSKKFIDEI